MGQCACGRRIRVLAFLRFLVTRHTWAVCSFRGTSSSPTAPTMCASYTTSGTRNMSRATSSGWRMNEEERHARKKSAGPRQAFAMVGCRSSNIMTGFCCQFLAESLAGTSICCLPGRLWCSCDSPGSRICRLNLYFYLSHYFSFLNLIHLRRMIYRQPDDRHVIDPGRRIKSTRCVI